MSPQSIRLMLAFGIGAALSACSGGGGSQEPMSPPVPTVTVTCPNDATASGATTDAANANCPAAQVLATTPSSGDTSVSPDSFDGVSVTTDSTLDVSSITASTVAFSSHDGNILDPVTGTVSYSTDTKQFSFVPDQKLNSGQQYVLDATVKDMLGRTVHESLWFTTSGTGTEAPAQPAPPAQPGSAAEPAP